MMNVQFVYKIFNQKINVELRFVGIYFILNVSLSGFFEMDHALLYKFSYNLNY